MFPWPPAEGESAVEAFATTWRESVFHPRRFFAEMPEDGPWGPPLLYALIVGVLASAIGLFWAHVLPRSADYEGMTGRERLQHPFQLLMHQGQVTLREFLMTPFGIVIGLLIGTLIIHMLVRIFISEAGPMSRTFRMLCYTSGPALFGIVPLIGGLVGGIWDLVITVIGIREVHRTTTGRAAVTLLAPFGCLVLLGFVLVFVIGAALGSDILSKITAP